jgi:hypothetical protein
MWTELVKEGPNWFMTIYYSRKTMVPGVAWTVESLTDLGDAWTGFDAELDALNPPQRIPGFAYEFISLRVRQPINGGLPARFFRVRVIKP